MRHYLLQLNGVVIVNVERIRFPDAPNDVRYVIDFGGVHARIFCVTYPKRRTCVVTDIDVYPAKRRGEGFGTRALKFLRKRYTQLWLAVPVNLIFCRKMVARKVVKGILNTMVEVEEKFK